MTSIVALSWKFRSFFFFRKAKVKQFCHCSYRIRQSRCLRSCSNKGSFNGQRGIVARLLHLRLVMIITIHVELRLKSKWFFQAVWIFEVWSFEVWVFEVWGLKLSRHPYFSFIPETRDLADKSLPVECHTSTRGNPQETNIRMQDTLKSAAISMVLGNKF